MRFIKVFFICLVFLVGFIAAWQNIPPILEQSITLRFDLHWLGDTLQWTTKPIPICLIIPLSFFAGLAFIGIVDIGTILRLRRRVKRLEKQLASAGYTEKKSAADLSNEKLSISSSSWGPSKEKQDTAA
jgi:uncharacterized integral membrane protein